MFNIKIRKFEIFLMVVLILSFTCMGIGLWKQRIEAQTPDVPIVAVVKSTGGGNSFAYESISITNTATALTSGTFTTDAKKAFLTLETGQIRFRIDGTDPTSSEGHLLEIGQNLNLHGYIQIMKFKGIRTGGTSGTIKATYLK